MTVYLKDAIDFKECAIRLSALFPKSPVVSIEASLAKYFWEDERSEYWAYNSEDATEQ